MAAASDSLPLLFLLYFLFGALYGLCLYFAPSLTSWAKILLGGAVLYSLAALWLLGGLVLFIIGFIIWGALGLYYLHSSLHIVPADRLHITSLGGRYWRAIPTGRTLLLPGERVCKELENPARQYTTPRVQVHLCDSAGHRFVVQASAIVGFCQSPVDALSKRVRPETWEDDLQKMIRDTLRDVIAISGHSALEKTQPLELPGREKQERRIEGQDLAQALLDQVRRRVNSLGLAIGWVRIRDLRFTRDPRFVKPEPHALATPVVLPPLGLDKSNPKNAGHGAGELEEPEELSIEALLDLYNTVRVNSINDPGTIRSIAEAFATLARDEDRGTSCPYDVKEVAELLFEYAASLDQKKSVKSS